MKKQKPTIEESIEELEKVISTPGLELRAEIKGLKEANKKLRGVYDHPNHDDPKERYLYEIRCAIKLLREFSGREGGGENAMGVAVQLDQFYKRARQALRGKL